MQMSGIAFSPSSVYFRNVEPNKSYSQPLTITNQELNPQRVKLITPKLHQFSLSDLVEFKVLAPGMSYNLFVFFKSNDPITKNIEDKILILQDNVTKDWRGAPVLKEIPVIAIVPSPDIRYDNEVNFGEVGFGVSTGTYITFSNHGKKQGFAFYLTFYLIISYFHYFLFIFLFIFCF
jgi:hypothetical protein